LKRLTAKGCFTNINCPQLSMFGVDDLYVAFAADLYIYNAQFKAQLSGTCGQTCTWL
jgi:hypothetical protein